LFVENKPVAVN